MDNTIVIRFAGESIAEGLEFVDVETENGKSVDVGRWKRDDGDWVLEI